MQGELEMIGTMLRELAQARGQAKISVLKRYNKEEIKTFLVYTYDTGFVYHIKPGPIEVMQCFDRTEPLHMDEITLLESLHRKKITGNVARDAVTRVASAHGLLIKLILARDLKCGVAATTINKAMPGLIPQFKAMKAKEVPLEKVVFPCYAQLKYDGVRLITTIKDNRVTFRTYNGKVVNLPKMAKTLVGYIDNVMLDGEITIRGGKMADRTSVSSMINSAMHGGRILEDKLEYAIFDCMSVGDFEATRCREPYTYRYRDAAAIVETIDSPLVAIARNQIVNSPIEVEALAKQLYTDKMEGLILKHPAHMYTFKRSKDWVKIKETKTADLTVLSVEEGKGKYQGMIGALVCSGKVEGQNITVEVGSGLSDAQRMLSPDYFIDETVEVKYNSVILNTKTYLWSLFLPRFVCVRFDK